MKTRAFTLIEVLVAASIIVVLGAALVGAGRKAYEESTLAIAANNIRQLNVGASAYLAENGHTYWPYRGQNPERAGTVWWFGFEPAESLAQSEGSRLLEPAGGPLGDYVPAGYRPDPGFRMAGKAFKPKYRFGYIGIGYNVLLGGGWLGTAPRKKYWDLADPAQVVVFSTSAQINTFQRPASSRNPMLEEFYGLDDRETTVHFRAGGQAMVGFANGAAGFLPMDESTRDPRAPTANVGRFAPVSSKKYLE